MTNSNYRITYRIDNSGAGKMCEGESERIAEKLRARKNDVKAEIAVV